MWFLEEKITKKDFEVYKQELEERLLNIESAISRRIDAALKQYEAQLSDRMQKTEKILERYHQELTDSKNHSEAMIAQLFKETVSKINDLEAKATELMNIIKLKTVAFQNSSGNMLDQFCHDASVKVNEYIDQVRSSVDSNRQNFKDFVSKQSNELNQMKDKLEREIGSFKKEEEAAKNRIEELKDSLLELRKETLKKHGEFMVWRRELHEIPEFKKERMLIDQETLEKRSPSSDIQDVFSKEGKRRSKRDGSGLTGPGHR